MPVIAAFREGLAREIRDYLDHCEIEQKERLTGKTSPNFESYVAIRFYTSAVRMYCYITQYVPSFQPRGSTLPQGRTKMYPRTAYGIELPMRMLMSSDMQTLWQEINLNIIMSVQADAGLVFTSSS